MGLSRLYDTTLLHMIFYGGISEASHVMAANLKSPSFVCLTSEVRALCLASCFEVCPQQHGQCSFCCPSVNLSVTVLHQIIWLLCWAWLFHDLAWGSAQWSSNYIYLDKINRNKSLTWFKLVLKWHVNTIIFNPTRWSYSQRFLW